MGSEDSNFANLLIPFLIDLEFSAEFENAWTDWVHANQVMRQSIDTLRCFQQASLIKDEFNIQLIVR